VTPHRRRGALLVLLFACLIFIPSLISPPHLMDDVDGANAQIPRNMIASGDWVTAHLDGVPYFEKPVGKYWLIALSMELFGQSDQAARVPISLAAILLCLVVASMARRAIGADAGFYAGLSLATCVGLWLFTRVLIPDILLTLGIAFALSSFERALSPDERRPRLWALAAWAAVGAGILLKGLIAAIFPLATAFLYLLLSGLWRKRETWRRVSILSGPAVMIAVAAPWIVLATLRNPPYFDFTMHSESGSYHGFFWFFFFNEHILRFLNRRYPHDYNTVPRAVFWLLHFAWFFPWSAFLLRAFGLTYRGPEPATRLRLLCLCWIAVVLGFFSLSTTQEYYSMPAYPAFAILIGSAMAESGPRAWKLCTRIPGVLAALACAAIVALLWSGAGYPTPGDISQGLRPQNIDVYTLSLGHMGDLTLKSFAYLRLPLAVAGIATLAGAVGVSILRERRAALALAVMMVLFFQAARLALIVFDPYLGSYPLANALNHAPPGGLVIDDPYYEMSSVFFYTNRTALILNGRRNNLEYGSYAPGAPRVFIGDADFVARWKSPDRWYVATEDEKVNHLRDLVGAEALHPIVGAGGKTVYVNR
jgi:4-amino-4-deoxy-L-arabinose transferase-like glycosyltransferase